MWQNYFRLNKIEFYFIDTDEIPGFFQWRKFVIQWRYNLYPSHGKVSRLSWLLQSHPTGKEPSQNLAIGVYIINRILHAGAWIRILSSSVQLDIPRVSAANASEISSWTLKDKICSPARACNILYIISFSPKTSCGSIVLKSQP